MPLTDEEREKLAKEIVKQFFTYMDTSIGTSVRRKLTFLILGLIFAGAVAIGIVKVPGW